MRTLDIYFDFISPFAYFLHKQLNRLPAGTQINMIPVLFAGLLKHWGHIGPVEITHKQLFTYRHCIWIAEKHCIDFKFPAAHPFNPLPYLRLSIALGNAADVVDNIYHAIWTQGMDPASKDCWQKACNFIGVADADQLIANEGVKNALKKNTDDAIGLGVFGVPTMVVDGKMFWGFDSLDMLIDYLNDEQLFQREDMLQVKSICEDK